jgi:Methyltransferase domain
MTPKWTLRARAKGWLSQARNMARTIVIDPRYGVDEAVGELRRRFERPAPPVAALRSPAWEQRFHELLGVPWPCSCAAELEPVWRDIAARLQQAGLEGGRGAFLGWDDGERALARAAWCATYHLAPQRVVETGVARGITTRTILEALERNGAGDLWSIDMPMLLHPERAHEIGVAVPLEMRAHWSLVVGASRQRLRPLLNQLGSIDLFVHDSLHTARNIRFELEHAWPALRSGGVAIVDDVHFNDGFHAWAQQAGDGQSLVCLPDDEQALFGIAVKNSHR